MDACGCQGMGERRRLLERGRDGGRVRKRISERGRNEVSVVVVCKGIGTLVIMPRVRIAEFPLYVGQDRSCEYG